ncbi:DNA-directed RNA polymerase subunit beta' [Dissostichus eleginoides]|uniref:DNA-directed RNA polymerase subunit beta n=1 Tax=Dissostichus eleginoides TaxID=100907 RepID=A0AAD9EZE5_DISEL|nr:DNA-directed RNA polymerase subunit beta' [Dissostichus eleginoides]
MRNCLACGQPKSRYLGDGSSVHFFYQSKTVKYFYCSTMVFKTYAKEGLKDTRMSFENFAATPFFERELEAARQRGQSGERLQRREGRGRQQCSCQQAVSAGCHQPLKQGPNSPHTHASFPGVPGKYIYCPSRVFSLYNAQGMEKELTWREFQLSDFYDAERDRWIADKRKT